MFNGLDCVYGLDQPASNQGVGQPYAVMPDYSEKPPLDAIGEVVELIGQSSYLGQMPGGMENDGGWKNKLNPLIIQQNQQNVCQVCDLLIQDQFLLKIGNTTCHEQCARCSICQQGFGDKCYERDSRLYCFTHYFDNFSPYHCAGCQQGINPSDMVYKLKTGVIYHVNCHCCYQCGRQLAPGEQIVVDEISKAVSCVGHSPAFSQIAPTPLTEPPPASSSSASEVVVKSEPTISKLFSSSSSSTKGEPSSSGDTQMHLPSGTVIPQYPFEMYAFGEMYSDDGRLMKRRGPRTTIKQNQLDVLNQIFSSTPKPSKHARAKLALETGLSMRVIQVWFQNRRSKERRLKHLCNFLRHYEQKGLVPPPFGFKEDGTVVAAGEPFSPQSFDCQHLLFDDDNDELSC